MDKNIIFKEIVIETPVDKIITQIKDLISSGQLKAGDRLPSERMLSQQFGVGRTHVRDAIRKLEFYGILKTLPQSGTVVAGFGITALEGLISDVLKVQGTDFYSLVESRVILETNAAQLAAQRRTKDDIVAIARALDNYEQAVKAGKPSVEEDLMFHLKISEASKNSVLNSLMLIVTPDILTYFTENNVCAGDRPVSALDEHYLIFEHIEKMEPEKAEKTMRTHLSDILNFSEKSQNPNE
ncbi:MAG TPA: GntR family transcriptional regulator [Cytophagales bacterium]|nr:GntR family transcriptional regulator [Cytophagales bacterium]HAA19231.1 GntR family transcriptional regulator [Cytophagales bacterium]HAP60651.1 GntR family transcriptional regulator [Cytophagales bacterium]